LDNLARQTHPVRVLVLANNTPLEQVKRLRRAAKKFFRYTRHKCEVKDLGEVKGYATAPGVTVKSGIISKVYNIGVGFADGSDFVFIVPGDVLLTPDSLYILLTTFNLKDAGIVCLTCYYRNKLENMPMVLPLFSVGQVSKESYEASPIYEARAGNGAMLYRTATAQAFPWRTGGPELDLGADYQLCEDIRLKTGLKCLIRSDMEVIHADEDGTLYYSGRIPDAPQVRDADKREVKPCPALELKN